MKIAAFHIFAASLAGAANPQEIPLLTLEHRMQLRCSAVFAIVAGEQQRGVASAAVYPPMGERGRKYFASTGARLMDDLKLSREQVEASMRAEADAIRQAASQAEDRAAYVDNLMRPCLSALDASGL